MGRFTVQNCRPVMIGSREKLSLNTKWFLACALYDREPPYFSLSRRARAAYYTRTLHCDALRPSTTPQSALLLRVICGLSSLSSACHTPGMCEEVLKAMNGTNYTASNSTYTFPEDLIRNGILAPPLGMIRYDVVKNTNVNINSCEQVLHGLLGRSLK